ncbi:hypothetical protein BB561_004507 [Smittium simulii]|uniref:ACB domain-containing protein n=1 Tax=Smittium simulii TaxID=133385 RepID=A0A2T9YFV8_9FUNG|nr:hypothetical protein BB561_004507 [Smittium simulii]
MADAESTGNAEFIKASVDVRNLPTLPSNDQGVVGDNKDPQPGMFDFKAKAKYNAWLSKAGITKEEAQAKYIELVHSLMA